MDNEPGSASVAIVPAYNEERDIAGVLSVLSTYPHFREVIVVDDGSVDATSAVASAFPVRVIRHGVNRGKGAAMETGIRATDTPVIFFCDADMHGLTHAMLDDILGPVMRGETDMVIAMRNWRMYYLGAAASVIPILGGQRALRRALWMKVPPEYKERFMIETALNFYARHWGNGYRYKVFPGLRQTIKEVKYGVVIGSLARARMFLEIISAQAQLQLQEAPETVRIGRAAAAAVIAGFFGASVGFGAVLASYVGPSVFLHALFADVLATDPHTPLIDALMRLASAAGPSGVAVFGVVVVGASASIIISHARYLQYLSLTRPPVGMM